MAHITKLPLVRHLRCDPTHHVIYYRRGQIDKKSGRGVAFWFQPLAASIAEIPCDDRELAFLFHARTSDYQDVTVQGVVTYRILHPEKIATRVDFSIDLVRGVWQKTPLEQIGHTLTQLAQQLAWGYVAHTPVRSVLAEGMTRAADQIREGFAAHAPLAEMGLEIVTVNVTGVSPTADVEKALQTPTREAIQQVADEATFQRRALAVEKERAIQENEMQNKIELAKREELLIGQQGQNQRRIAREASEAQAIAAEGAAARERLASAVKADGLRTVGSARVEGEKARMAVYRDVPSPVMLSLAARRLAGKLRRIDHLNVVPDLLGPAIANLLEAGANGSSAPARKPNKSP